MTSGPEVVGAALGRRAARARHLATREPATVDPLRFYAAVLDAQADVLRADGGASLGHSRPSLAGLDPARIAMHAAPFVRALLPDAPAPLREALQSLRTADAIDWGEAVAIALAPGPPAADVADPVRAFVADALVQPFAELAARAWAEVAPDERGPAASSAGTEQRCPCCGDRAVVGVLREQGHGAGRLLVCGRCATEWPAPRMVCPSCAAVDVQALPVFRAEAWPAVRVESCERCQCYLKSIDVTVDGAAVPLVDDLASLPLDLWAQERGFIRPRAHLLRI